MFAPLDPSIVSGSPDYAVHVRCDVATDHYPFSMHVSHAVAAPVTGGHFVEQIPNGWGNATIVPVEVGSLATMSQVDAALQREGACPIMVQRPIGLDIHGVSVEPVEERRDRSNSAVKKPVSLGESHSRALTEYPQDAQRRDSRWKLEPQDTVIPGPSLKKASRACAEPTGSNVPETRGTFRTYTQSAAAAESTAEVAWSKGLLASSRRGDWIWPKVVSELIGRQWSAINQLGRTALGNSREETRRILVTSTKRGEGRTTIALALARWAAMTGQRTLLVDADVVQPGIAAALRVSPTGDWRKSSLAFGVENSLITCRSLPLSLLPLGDDEVSQASQSAHDPLIVQLAVAEQEFDCCILDASPIAALCEQISIVTRLASSIVVVNNHAEGVSHALIGACNLLWQRGKPALAIADNFHR